MYKIINLVTIPIYILQTAIFVLSSVERILMLRCNFLLRDCISLSDVSNRATHHVICGGGGECRVLELTGGKNSNTQSKLNQRSIARHPIVQVDLFLQWVKLANNKIN